MSKINGKIKGSNPIPGVGGFGDMTKAVYDPTGRNTDIFNYVDTSVTGLLDYRGSYDASSNTFPTTGGSGAGGAVLKADIWTISIQGTLGGVVAYPGDMLIAKINTPGQTAGNWDIISVNVPVLAVNRGGTGASSFTAPVGNINPLIFYNGITFAVDTTPSHLGYDAVNDRVKLSGLDISAATTSVATYTNTAAQSTTGGAGMLGYADSGAAMSSGNRLGFMLFGGAIDNAHTLVNSVGFAGFATEAWSATNQGGRLDIYTTPNGSTAVAGRRTVASFGQDGTFNIGVGLTTTGLTDLLVNPTTKTSGNLIDLQVNGVSKFSVSYGGNANIPTMNTALIAGSGTAPGIDVRSTATFTGSIGVRLQNATSTLTSGSFQAIAITPTYNQSAATTANTDLFINRTETAVGSGAQLLADFQVNGVSKFKVDNTGNVFLGNLTSIIIGNSGYYNGSSLNGTLIAPNTSATGFAYTKTDTNTSGTSYGFKILPTYNQTSGTAANTDLLINRTQTAVGSGAQNLIDAQVGGVSKFKVDNTGSIAIGNTVATAAAIASTHKVTVVIGGVTYYLLASNV